MRFEPLPLEGVWSIELEPHSDERGSFSRTFCEDEFAENGLPTHFPQCNLSSNHVARTLRGMHVSVGNPSESKLIRCVRGSIYDVVVDMRAGSPTQYRWVGAELSAENGRALYVPPGFAHGFLTLVDASDVYYHMGARYVVGAERGFRWNDPAFAIDWPLEPRVVCHRDASYPDFDPDRFGSTVDS